MTAVDTLVADLNAGKYSSAAQNIIAPVADFVAALNEIQGNTTNGNFTSVTINANAPNVAPAGGQLVINAADGTSATINLFSYGNGSLLVLDRANGTQALPSAIVNNDVMALIGVRGWDGAFFQYTTQIRVLANENWGAGRGSDFYIITTPTGSTVLTTAAKIGNGTAIFTNNGTASLAVGRQGATNPVLNVDASVANVVTGLNVAGAAAAGGVAVSAISSGAAENLTIDAKGTGTLTLQGTATGNISLARTVTAGNAAAFQLTNSVASATVPTLVPNRTSATTGIGAQAAGNISFVVAGVEIARVVGTGLTMIAGTLTLQTTTLLATSVALTNNAAASAGTLTNAPAVGNPTKWIPINDNGTTRNIPAW